MKPTIHYRYFNHLIYYDTIALIDYVNTIMKIELISNGRNVFAE